MTITATTTTTAIRYWPRDRQTSSFIHLFDKWSIAAAARHSQQLFVWRRRWRDWRNLFDKLRISLMMNQLVAGRSRVLKFPLNTNGCDDGYEVGLAGRQAKSGPSPAAGPKTETFDYTESPPDQRPLTRSIMRGWPNMNIHKRDHDSR